MWWEDEIDEEVALQFIQESAQYTQKVIETEIPDLKNERWNHQLPSIERPFTPMGAIIHSSNTATMAEALRLMARRVHGAHVLIMKNMLRKPPGELLRHMPSLVLMPMGHRCAVPHAGYMSQLTWGIELRNVGRLRPWGIEGERPLPIYEGEEYPSAFHARPGWKPSQMSLHWRQDMWREEFSGHAHEYHKCYYEQPSKGQAQSLMIVLRVLNALSPMRRELILPSHCVNGFTPVLPSLLNSMSHIRDFATDPDYPMKDPSSFLKDEYPDTKFSNVDEPFITSQIALNRWRAALDDGEKDFILNGPDAELSNNEERILTTLGYSQEDIPLALRMFSVNCNIHQDYFTDAIGQLEKKLSLFWGE